MTQEYNSQEVINFALQQVSNLPDVRNGRNVIKLLSIGIASAIYGIAVTANLTAGNHLHRATLMAISILQNIDAAQAFFAEVLTHDGDKIVEVLFLLEVCHFSGKLVEIEY